MKEMKKKIRLDQFESLAFKELKLARLHRITKTNKFQTQSSNKKRGLW